MYLSPIAFDLTELFFRPSHGQKYYGIARVVEELAIAFFKARPDTVFVVFSNGHRKFHRVFPFYDDTHPSGVNLNVPHSIRSIMFRTKYLNGISLATIYRPFLCPVMRLMNRLLWMKSGIPVDEILLDGRSFFSAARPKLMIDLIECIEKKNWDTKITALVHDAIPIHKVGQREGARPQKSALHDLSLILQSADQIIANSRFTEHDLLELTTLGTLPTPKRVTAVQLAHEFRHSNEEIAARLPEEPYYLCVGSSVGRKNLEVVFEAMIEIHDRGCEVPLLVLAGRRDRHVIRHLKKTDLDPIRRYIVHVLSPNQAELSAFYQSALALIIPSKMEGWGLPAGEALYLGCPVISAAIPALKECCGDLAHYFDPGSARQLADQLQIFQLPKGPRADLVEIIDASHPTLRTWSDVQKEIMQACA